MAAAQAIISIEQPHPEEEEEEASWADLPFELVYLIMDKMSSSPHLITFGYIRFGSVCTRWNVLFYDHNPLPQPPLLMISASLNKKKKKHKTRLRSFYNACDNKIDSSLQVRMPRYRYCRGSSHGWLITVDDDENNAEILFSTRLLNPFMCSETGKYGDHEILLPSLDTFPLETPYHYTFLVKAVLSANPLTNPTDYTVMSIYGTFNWLAFLKPGDKVWTSVELAIEMNDDPHQTNKDNHFEDIIYWRDEFYAIQCSGRVVVCVEVDAAEEGSGMTAIEFTQPPKIEYNKKNYTRKYLVASSDAKTLMQVHRDVQQYHLAADGRTLYSTVEFRVFQLSILLDQKDDDDITTEDLYWAEVKTLGGDTMFLGHNTSISISASSDYTGCKPNCIYYTDDNDSFYAYNQPVGPRDMGVFNLEDGSFLRHFPIDSNNTTSLQSIWPVPIWIQPTVPKSNKMASTSSDEEE